MIRRHALIFLRTAPFVFAWLAIAPAVARATEPAQWADSNVADLVELYRSFHRAPELSFHEKETGARLAGELEAAGAEVTTDVGGHGVVGILKNGPGPVLMIRTDTDALPVVENTNLVYASKVRTKNDEGQDVGVMHACGHDIHMTSLVGVARYLAANKDLWSGTVMFICQPAEERGAGAKAMLEDRLFERFTKPDFALALHVDSSLAAGVDSVDITMRGRGGHGAYPHSTIDPIVQAAHLVIDLQSIVSREISPTESAVITVGSIHGGAKHNVIPDTCHLKLTVRSYSDAVRQHLLEGIRRKAMAVAQGANAPEPEVTISEGTPSMYNDPDLVARVAPILAQALGDANVTEVEPVMGGEDFSQFGRAGVPIFMYRLGSIEAPRLERMRSLGQKPASLHSALYYPDAEPTLKAGVTSMASAALSLLPKND